MTLATATIARLKNLHSAHEEIWCCQAGSNCGTEQLSIYSNNMIKLMNVFMQGEHNVADE